MTLRKIKLGEVLRRVKNLVEIENDKEYKLVTVKMHHKGVTLRNITKGSELGSKKMHSVKSGEFILSGIDARHGAFGIIPSELEGAVVTNDFWCLEFDESVIDKHLFLKLTSTSFFDDLCKKASDGTTNRVRLQAEKFYNLEIDLPSVDEQKEIIEGFLKVENYNNQITTELSHQLELVRQLRQAFLREAMQGKLVKANWSEDAEQNKIQNKKVKRISFDDRVFSELKLNINAPNNWQIEPLAIIASEIVDCPHSTPKWTNSGKICVRTNQFRPGKLDFSDCRYVSDETYLKRIERLEPLENDILYSREGGILGIACRVPKNIQLCLGQRMMIIRAGKQIDSAFLEMALNSPLITEIAELKTLGGAAPRINVATIKAYPIPLPPLAEQKRIVEKLEKLMKYCDQLEANIRESKKNAESLLQVALKEALAG